MDKKKLAVVLIVIALLFLVVSVVMVYSFTSLGTSFGLKKSVSGEVPAGQIKLVVEGNEFSEVGK